MEVEKRVVEVRILEPLLLPVIVADKTVADVQDALDRHTPVDQRNQCNQTGLHVACELGKDRIVELLISRHAPLEAKDEDGTTPLIAASRCDSQSCAQLMIDAGANIDALDTMDWTALMWASYKGHADTVKILLSHGANVNYTVSHNMNALMWASGRGHLDVVKLLLKKEAKVNSSDKFGNTPLIWASRRGYCEIVTLLLEHSADINAVGAGGANAIITAAKNGYEEIIQLLLQSPRPNVNHIDKDSNTALIYAAKQGKNNTILMLLNAGAYLNLANRSGQTPLIKAAKHGHFKAVSVLLNRYAYVDIRGKDNWTALHHSCERSYIGIIQEILSCKPDLEIVNNNGDTALLLAVKNRNLTATRMLIEKGALVSATDKKKDTPLHIAVRAGSVRIASLLLRRPQDVRLLYQSNNDGETPYNLDAANSKGILSALFGTKYMSAEEHIPDMAGSVLPGHYDVYSSVLAGILSEPTLAPPLTVGLYAKWGSGKSILLQRLQQLVQQFTPSIGLYSPRYSGVITLVTVFFICLFLGGLCAALSSSTERVAVGAGIGTSFFFTYCLLLGLVVVGKWKWTVRVRTLMQNYAMNITLIFKLWFMVPPSKKRKEVGKAIPVRFLFAKYNRLASVGGQTSLAEMISLLCRTTEKNLGFLTIRLYRPFQEDLSERGHASKYRKICCVPAFIYVIIFILSSISILLIVVISYGPNAVEDPNLTKATGPSGLNASNLSILLLAVLDLVILIIGAPTIAIMISSLIWSQQTRVLHAASRVKSQETLVQQLKKEVDLLRQTVMAIDAFTETQTRICVTINGLDSCEQDTILQVLDTIQVLFSHKPYITILSIDPILISKAIHGSLKSAFRHAGISGYDYLKNVVHLPFFLRDNKRKLPTSGAAGEQDAKDGAKQSTNKYNPPSRLLPLSERQDSSQRSAPNPADPGQLIRTEDWLQNISPRLVKRIMHIVTLAGRLLHADDTDFSWSKLAAWIYVTEQWPYRTSFLLHILERDADKIKTTDSLQSVYEKNCELLNPNDPKLVIDSSDDLAFRSFLSARSITVWEVHQFLPSTVNLDPKMFDPISLSETTGNSMSSTEKDSSSVSRHRAIAVEDSSFVVTKHLRHLTVKGSRDIDAWKEPIKAMTVDEVAYRICNIKGLSTENARNYARFVRLNNLNGVALLACDIDDLKKELFAPFGDWCLLKQWVNNIKLGIHENESKSPNGSQTSIL